jgi:NADH:ubiquinone oxidoreductase subunit 4 (subunit M)
MDVMYLYYHLIMILVIALILFEQFRADTLRKFFIAACVSVLAHECVFMYFFEKSIYGHQLVVSYYFNVAGENYGFSCGFDGVSLVLTLLTTFIIAMCFLIN